MIVDLSAIKVITYEDNFVVKPGDVFIVGRLRESRFEQVGDIRLALHVDFESVTYYLAGLGICWQYYATYDLTGRVNDSFKLAVLRAYDDV